MQAARHLLASPGMRRWREANEHAWRAIVDTIAVAGALGGHLPVRYYMHETKEGFGRRKSMVMVDGEFATACVPYVRMMRAVRTVLAGALYWDVDMVNCQPCLLRQRLVQHGIPCPLLTRYVEGREACLLEVQQAACKACADPRGAAKALFIRLLFFGGVRGWEADHTGAVADALPAWVPELRRELQRNAEVLLRMNEQAELRAMHARRAALLEIEGETSDATASQMALFLQTLESRCVRALVGAIQADGRAVGGIIYDGVLVERREGEAAPPSAEVLEG